MTKNSVNKDVSGPVTVSVFSKHPLVVRSVPNGRSVMATGNGPAFQLDDRGRGYLDLFVEPAHWTASGGYGVVAHAGRGNAPRLPLNAAANSGDAIELWLPKDSTLEICGNAAMVDIRRFQGKVTGRTDNVRSSPVSQEMPPVCSAITRTIVHLVATGAAWLGVARISEADKARTFEVRAVDQIGPRAEMDALAEGGRIPAIERTPVASISVDPATIPRELVGIAAGNNLDSRATIGL